MQKVRVKLWHLLAPIDKYLYSYFHLQLFRYLWPQCIYCYDSISCVNIVSYFLIDLSDFSRVPFWLVFSTHFGFSAVLSYLAVMSFNISASHHHLNWQTRNYSKHQTLSGCILCSLYRNRPTVLVQFAPQPPAVNIQFILWSPNPGVFHEVVSVWDNLSWIIVWTGLNELNGGWEELHNIWMHTLCFMCVMEHLSLFSLGLHIMSCFWAF